MIFKINMKIIKNLLSKVLLILNKKKSAKKKVKFFLRFNINNC